MKVVASSLSQRKAKINLGKKKILLVVGIAVYAQRVEFLIIAIIIKGSRIFLEKPRKDLFFLFIYLKLMNQISFYRCFIDQHITCLVDYY